MNKVLKRKKFVSIFQCIDCLMKNLLNRKNVHLINTIIHNTEVYLSQQTVFFSPVKPNNNLHFLSMSIFTPNYIFSHILPIYIHVIMVYMIKVNLFYIFWQNNVRHYFRFYKNKTSSKTHLSQSLSIWKYSVYLYVSYVN